MCPLRQRHGISRIGHPAVPSAGGTRPHHDHRHPDDAFWISLDQAVDLVLYALEQMVGGEVFIPKIPSMRVTDLARAIAPDAEVDVIGIRPGEKLHEVLMTGDETRHSVDAGGVYVVLPEHPWWVASPRWMEGKPLVDGFVYSSDSNDHWLGEAEIAELLS